MRPVSPERKRPKPPRGDGVLRGGRRSVLAGQKGAKTPLRFGETTAPGRLARAVRVLGHRRTFRALAIVLIAATVGAGLFLGGHVQNAVLAAGTWAGAQARAMGLVVEVVAVDGAERTGPEALYGALGVAPGDLVLGFDPAAARARIEALPWVAEARVTRLLPGEIRLRITEREAFARWQMNYQIEVIDRQGRPIPGAQASAFADLPLVVGPGANEAAGELVALLARDGDVRAQVAAATRFGARRWDLHFANGLVVKLPERDAERALQTVARLMREGRLLERDVAVLDLRLADRVSILRATGEQEFIQGGQDI